MTNQTNIFGLRFRSNEKVQPTLEELRIFLESRKHDGKGKTHDGDLAPYRDMLKRVDEFERTLQSEGSWSIADRIFYGALTHSHLVKPALRSAVEQYKYHLHTLTLLDFKKPASFIKSAEDEISRLNPKKKEEAVKRERLHMMVDERKRAVDALTKQWINVGTELSHILEYIWENLALIEKLAEASIEILVKNQISRKKEGEQVEDIKNLFKERLREARHQGTITPQQMEAAKADVAALAKKLSDLVRGDVYVLTGVYEAIHEHVRKVFHDIESIKDAIERQKHQNFDEDLKLYSQAEQLLVSLITDCRCEIKPVATVDGTGHDEMLNEKRREMLNHFFELLRQGPQS